MVTGTLPYVKEAQTNDPLYKFIYLKKRDLYWSNWRSFNGRVQVGSVSAEDSTHSSQNKTRIS